MFPPKKGMLGFFLSYRLGGLPSGFLSSFPSSSAESRA